MSSRNTDTASYRVYPIADAPEVQLTIIQDALVDLCGKDEVLPTYRLPHSSADDIRFLKTQKTPIYWHITVQPDSDVVDRASKIAGVDRVEPWRPRKRSTSPDVPPTLDRPDFMQYSVILGTGDAQSVQDFLESKTQPGTKFAPLRGTDEKIKGWLGVWLDEAAKKDVEEHEGVAKVQPSRMYHSFDEMSSSDHARRENPYDHRSQTSGADHPAPSPSTGASNIHPDLSLRDDKTYVVVAEHVTDIKALEDFLKSKVRPGTDFWPSPNNDNDENVAIWHGLILDDAAKAEVESHESIQRVFISEQGDVLGASSSSRGNDEQLAKPMKRGDSEEDAGLTTSHPRNEPRDYADLSRRDVQDYVVIARKITDLKAIEAFLSSKVQAGTKFWPFATNNKHLAVWSGVMLDDIAKAEVEKHEEIEFVRTKAKAYDFQASADSHDEADHLPVSARREDAEGKAEATPNNPNLVPRDFQSYLVMLNGTDTEPLQKFLESKKQSGTKFYPFKDSDDKVVGWYGIWLNEAAKKEVESRKDVAQIKLDEIKTYFRALDHGYPTWPLQLTDEQPKIPNTLLPRANRWRDFVEEFHPDGNNYDNIVVLQTQPSIDGGEDPQADDNHEIDSHGTIIAAKALGTRFGVAKSATLIVVKASKFVSDDSAGLRLVVDHMRQNPGRAERSVVLMSVGSPQAINYEQAKADLSYKAIYETPLTQLTEMGVPVVLAAGNNLPEEGSNRPHIDTVPQIYASQSLPLILVGAADFEGKRVTQSRYGDQLTIYAPGHSILSLSKGGFDSGERLCTGTSYAAPQVAGLIATYLTQDSVNGRWAGLQGAQRVEEIRRYLVSGDSAWARHEANDEASGKQIRMIWNGAKKEDHESAGASSNSPPAPPPASTPPSAPTKALSIIYRYVIDNGADYSWRFYETSVSKSVQCSESKPLRIFKTNDGLRDDKTAPWPVGTFAIKVHGEDCEYKNDGQGENEKTGKGNAGMLWCGGKGIACHADSKRMDETPGSCGGWNWETKEYAVVFCEW
ncbi:peptidase S8/S53 domain-containing protein [Paraphoma chrysanthemicola]|nr:peptidase S8/S53 domain-containing protein [Paraphoma chrysanthemicola]